MNNEATANTAGANAEAEVRGSVGADRCLGPDSMRPLIEIGWIIAGTLDDEDLQATRQARDDAQSWLQRCFPDFEWIMPIVEREEVVRAQRVEPVELLDYGVTERNLRNWDFTLIITPADLVSYYRNDALSVVSRAMQAAVISTARLDPQAYRPSASETRRIELISLRIKALVIHLVGHLAGLEHVEDRESFMASFQTVEDLDKATRLSSEQSQRLHHGLHGVADRRLEEQADVRRAWTPWFYLQAAWINRRQITEAVIQAKPWQFSFRLSRLTTAAVSAMLVLMITAEAWELGLSQPGFRLALLSCVAVVLTTFYVLVRQRLFVRREHARLSELSVVTNVSTCAIVLLGMVTTFAMLAVVTFVTGQFFFASPLIANWAPSADPVRDGWAYVKLAVFVASISLFIGSFGASFEQQHYFRHITYVDEEI